MEESNLFVSVAQRGTTYVFISCMILDFSRCLLLIGSRSPTLSYTHRLESRVKELEEKLAELEGKPSPYRTVTEDAYPSHHTSGFGGLKLDEKGAITYHGATSFFQPLGDSATGKQRFQDTSTAQDLSLNKRQTLVSNAWRQRALENLSEIPVSSFPHLDHT